MGQLLGGRADLVTVHKRISWLWQLKVDTQECGKMAEGCAMWNHGDSATKPCTITGGSKIFQEKGKVSGFKGD